MMKRDFEWLKGEIAKRMIELEPYRADKLRDERYKTLRSVAQKLNQLDEPEVLSQEWVDNNSVNASHDGMTEEYIHVVDLKNLIVPKQDLPVIPKYVADWIEENREWYGNIFLIGYDIYNNNIQPDVDDWIMDNEEGFVRVWMEGYEVEEESLYYALVKGHELVTDEGDIACKYWNLRVPTGDVLPSNRYSRRGEFVVKMSKSEWNELGINDSNADFVEVAE